VERKREKGWKIGFWNVAGIENKNEKFWKGLRRWDIIVMVKTWDGQKRMEKDRGKAAKGFYMEDTMGDKER